MAALQGGNLYRVVCQPNVMTVLAVRTVFIASEASRIFPVFSMAFKASLLITHC